MDIYSLRVRHISEETQKLNDIMLEIQRLRALVARAEVDVLSGRHPEKAPPARSLRLAVNASTGRVASPA
jgi:isochorismate hydrolase